MRSPCHCANWRSAPDPAVPSLRVRWRGFGLDLRDQVAPAGTRHRIVEKRTDRALRDTGHATRLGLAVSRPVQLEELLPTSRINGARNKRMITILILLYGDAGCCPSSSGSSSRTSRVNGVPTECPGCSR